MHLEFRRNIFDHQNPQARVPKGLFHCRLQTAQVILQQIIVEYADRLVVHPVAARRLEPSSESRRMNELFRAIYLNRPTPEDR